MCLFARQSATYKGRSLLIAPRQEPCGRDSRKRLPPWVFDGETRVRIRMKDSRLGNPVGGQPVHSRPREAILLAAPPQRSQPDALHIVVECSQRDAIRWHRVVCEEASDHLLDPSPLLGDWLVHPPSQPLLDLPELGPHAITPCDPLDEELPTAVAFTDEGKAEEVEGLRLAEPTLSASVRRKAAELDQASLFRIERQRELLEPLAHVVPESSGVSFVLKAHDEVVGIAHHDHVARGLAPSPALSPEVEHVVQVDIGEERRDHRALPGSLCTNAHDP